MTLAEAEARGWVQVIKAPKERYVDPAILCP
jgi:hypothetical protein